MPIVYSNAAGAGRLQVSNDLIAGKTLAAATGSATAGSIVVGTNLLSGATGVLATFALPTTPLSITNKLATLQGTPLNSTWSANGTAAKAELRNNAGTVVASGLTVGLSGSGADIILDSVTASVGLPVSVTSGTITHP